MCKLEIIINPEVYQVFSNYPEIVHKRLSNLRRIILEAANEIDNLEEIEETLKWNEPSYLAKKGSTIRIDWKTSKPDQYAIYFKCTSKLVPTFKMVFGKMFNYEENRALIFNMNDKIPEVELKRCISVALTYHKVKHLPLLGLQKG